MAKGVAADEDAYADALSARGQGRQKGPGLEVRAIGAARLHEVVAVPDAVEAKPLEELPALSRPGPAHILVGAESEAKPPSHLPSSVSRRRLRGRPVFSLKYRCLRVSAGSPAAAYGTGVGVFFTLD